MLARTALVVAWVALSSPFSLFASQASSPPSAPNFAAISPLQHEKNDFQTLEDSFTRAPISLLNSSNEILDRTKRELSPNVLVDAVQTLMNNTKGMQDKMKFLEERLKLTNNNLERVTSENRWFIAITISIAFGFFALLTPMVISTYKSTRVGVSLIDPQSGLYNQQQNPAPVGPIEQGPLEAQGNHAL